MTDKARSIEAGDQAFLLHPTTNLHEHRVKGPLVLTHGQGVRVWDNQGHEYIEAMAGLWCNSLGHGDEELAKVAYEQTKSLSFAHLFQGRTHEPAVRLCEKLIELAPYDLSKVFLGCSGSDANDTQIKMIWYYNNAIGRPQKKKIISRKGGYHGVTIGSGSLTGMDTFHEAFDLPLPFARHVEYPNFRQGAHAGESEEDFVARLVRELEDLIIMEGPDTVAAFIAEPICAAGGVIVPPDSYFPAIHAVLNKYDILLIDDEVVCGFGRTGNIFGAQTVGMQPSTMTLAKALSSGYAPISAVLIPQFMVDAFEEMSAKTGNFGHGYTYSGHPLCAAIALRTLEIYEERDIYSHAAKVGAIMQKRLAGLMNHPLIGEVRGTGLIGAIQIAKTKDPLEKFDSEDGVGAFCAARCLVHGVLTRASGDSLMLCPPLVITDNEIDEMFDRLTLALDDTLAMATKEKIVA